MAYRYPDYEDRVILRRLAVIGAIAIACAAAYVGLSKLDEPVDEEFITLDQLTTNTTTPSASAATTTSAVTATTVRQPTTTTSIVASGALPVPSTTTDSSTTDSSTTDPPIFQPGTASDVAAPPVVAIFDVETITLAGAVPSQAAADRLTTLARANSKTPAAVIDLLTIDPSVPEDVGVRVVELNSTRFPGGEATITLAHGAELERIVTFMKALPETTVMVVGHADQHGTDADNLALSRDRAEAVVEFLIDKGIEHQRLAAEAVGESDLLSLEDDDAALALNRRTEFVIYGALVGA